MKLIRPIFFIFLLSLAIIPSAMADKDGFKSNMKDIGIVTGRGLVNVATFWLELPRAFKVERREHPKVWPVGLIPRYFTFMVYRGFSGGMDFIFHPFVVPFSEGTPRPWTEPMGLPDYVWQKGDVDL